MLDLHCHILPGIDDGPPHVSVSLALAEDATEGGVHTLAATPHCRPDHPSVVPRELAQRTVELQSILDDVGVPLELVTAGEVDLVWAQDASDEDLRLVSYGQRGTDLLVESPYGELTASFEHLLFRLTYRGYRVLLAHPERNPTFQRDPARLAELVARGVLLQVTASSLVRRKRSKSSSLARSILERDLVHVIASDAHGPAAPGRATLLEGVELAADIVGAERARWLVEAAPTAILAGEGLPEPPPSQSPRVRLGL